jgi:hypothetical protein
LQKVFQQHINMSTQDKPLSAQHWSNKRSAPIDRSKRVAPGGELSSANIRAGTRERPDHDYRLLNRQPQLYDQENLIDRPWQESTTDEHVKSKNVLEKRAKITTITNKMGDLSLKKEKKKKEPKEEQVEEKATDIPMRTRKSNGSSRRRSLKAESNLKPEIVDRIKDLGGSIVPSYGDMEYQHSLGHAITVQPWLQTLLNIKWPENGQVLSSEEHNVFGIKWGQFALPKSETEGKSALRKKDAVLIGDGEVILAVNQDSALQEDKDVLVQIIDDQNDEVEQVLLSELLAKFDWEDDQEDEEVAASYEL